MPFDRIKAAEADVEFVARTGRAEHDVTQFRRQLHRDTDAMSDDVIRLALAQNRLNNALHKFGPESDQAKRALLDHRRALAQVESGTKSATSQIDRADRATHRWRNTLSGLKIAAGSLLAGGGIVYALRSVIGVAAEQENVLGQTEVALESAGLSWERYGQRIERAIKRQSRLGFDDEELLRTFQMFVRRSGDVEQALEDNALAANVARGRYISLEQAAQIVTKAWLGQAGALRRLGIDAEKGASGVELVRMLTVKYAGAAVKASTEAVGAQARLNVAWEEGREIVGTALLPAVIKYEDRLSSWLSKAENQEQLQRRVNQVVEDGGAVLQGLAEGMSAAREATAPLVDAFGGLENVVKVAFGLWIVTRLRNIAGALGLVRTRAFGAAAGFTALAAAETKATTAGAAAAAGPVGGGNWLAKAAATALLYPELSQFYKEAFNLPTLAGPQAAGDLIPVFRNGKYVDPNTGEPVKDQAFWRDRDRRSGELIRRGIIEQLRAGKQPTFGITPLPSGDSASRGRPRRTDLDFELDLARAQASPGTGDERRLITRRMGYIESVVASLEKRKSLTKEGKERLRNLYAELAQLDSSLDALAEQDRQKQEERDRIAAKKAADAAARRRKLVQQQQRMAELDRREASIRSELSDERKLLQNQKLSEAQKLKLRKDIVADQLRLLDVLDQQDKVDGKISAAEKRAEGRRQKRREDLLRQQRRLGLQTASGSATESTMTAADWKRLFFDLQGTFLGSFMPNVFTQSPGPDGRTVRNPGSQREGRVAHLHINFPTPPSPGLSHEMQYAMHKLEALDGLGA